MTSILVFAEHFGGKLVQPSREALGFASTLGEVTALVAGQGVDEVVKEAFAYGAKRVLKADDASLKDFRFDPYVALLVSAVKEHQPALIIAPNTTRGREIIGGAAADLEAGLLTDCLDVKLDGGKVVVKRPGYAGKVVSNASIAASPAFITLRGRAFKANEPQAGASGEVKSLSPVLAEGDITSKIESFEESTSTVSLADAAIIVSGGRGVGGPEGFAPVRDLAAVLGAAVGASRAAVDAGWIPYEHQVGQTGKVVAPDLYIAAGISGAIQHQAGMRTAKTIVAINKDGDAPIFALASYGVVGDLFQLLPALTNAFKEKLGK
jgi:electron transfer flavoprotein alpha subunit